ncbi:hypothetical protein [Krasilnikovia sp. MM14-A1259]|uniref:hypothetical protein n=1 Tax=Krasilnikovia sp. MM14-A1259 TaxID=3373539 RepID=UPI003805F7E1
MVLVERSVAGRIRNSLIAGPARRGTGISAATLAGTRALARACALAGTPLAPLEEQTARSPDSWHLHADETSWHVLTPDEPVRFIR